MKRRKSTKKERLGNRSNRFSRNVQAFAANKKPFWHYYTKVKTRSQLNAKEKNNIIKQCKKHKKRRERAPAMPFITAFQPDKGELLNPSIKILTKLPDIVKCLQVIKNNKTNLWPVSDPLRDWSKLDSLLNPAFILYDKAIKLSTLRQIKKVRSPFRLTRVGEAAGTHLPNWRLYYMTIQASCQ